MISPLVVRAVGLAPIGMRQMTSATHSVPVNVYLANLLLPFGQTGYLVPSIPLMEFAQGWGDSFQILLGRDILCQGILTLSFDGHFTFAL